jgi:hypothetical protein
MYVGGLPAIVAKVAFKGVAAVFTGMAHLVVYRVIASYGKLDKKQHGRASPHPSDVNFMQNSAF